MRRIIWLAAGALLAAAVAAGVGFMCKTKSLLYSPVGGHITFERADVSLRQYLQDGTESGNAQQTVAVPPIVREQRMNGWELSPTGMQVGYTTIVVGVKPNHQGQPPRSQLLFFDRQWKNVGEMLRSPPQPAVVYDLWCEPPSNRIGVLAGSWRPDGWGSTLAAGTVDLRTRQFVPFFHAPFATVVGSVWFRGGRIATYTGEDQNIVVELNATKRSYRVVYTEAVSLEHSQFEDARASPGGGSVALDRIPVGADVGGGVWLLTLADGRMRQITAERRLPYHHYVSRWIGEHSLEFLRKQDGKWDLYRLDMPGAEPREGSRSQVR